MAFKTIQPTEIKVNLAELFAHRPALLTAGDADGFNTMIIGWGAIGPLWFRMTASVYVRPCRYTFKYMESGDYFSICFFKSDMRQRLKICGEKSGKDVDKVKECGLTPLTADCGAVYFEQAELAVICKKQFCHDFAPDDFVSDQIPMEYDYKDFHRMYIGEIIEVLEKV